MLETSDAPVKDVARAVGIAGPSHFSRVFAATYGVPPREWRKAQPATHV
jgi:transcriptional regulator GlxA family with amidase domain